MFTKYLALLSESKQVSSAEISQISAALQKQITRDFSPIWQIPATIDAFGKLEEVPSDYWPIVIKDDIGYDAAGIHLDRNGQPFALVQASNATNATALTCSHEAIEMLVDPFGNRFVASQSIKPDQGRVNYLVEACDPSEGDQFGYSVNGILLSDFYTPNYFDPVFSPSVRYSFTGAITKPREVLKDGYISWMIPESGEWWQATFFGEELEFVSKGILKRKVSQSWRETIDTNTLEPLKKLAKKNLLRGQNLSEVMLAASLEKSSNGRAKQLREDIDALIRVAR
jgi:hypothetical protein